MIRILSFTYNHSRFFTLSVCYGDFAMTFYKKNVTPLLLSTSCLILLLFLAGCSRTTSHEVIKYENDKLNTTPHALVPGFEPGEAGNKILVSVNGQGLAPVTGTRQQKKLLAERAAIIDGYRKLSERLGGMILSAYSQAGKNNISVDQVTTETNTYLRGAQVAFVSHDDGIARANIRVYLAPREFKFYNGSSTSRSLLGGTTGAVTGAAAGSATATALGQNSATLEALGGTGGAMALGAGAGAIAGSALMEE
jgi:hypothetical protein